MNKKLLILPLAAIGGMLIAGRAEASSLFSSNLFGDSPVVPSNKNLSAFMAMIRIAETGFETGDERQYRTLFGSTPRSPVLFQGFADHPRIAKPFKDKNGVTLFTTAAGGYQAMAISKTPTGMTRVNTWDRIKKKLNLPDFRPPQQDRFCEELCRERGALGDILEGRFYIAVQKVSKEWASLPGGNYPQPTKKLSDLMAMYKANGGLA